MRIALIGYGRMGRAVEAAAAARGHEVVLRVAQANRHELAQVHPDAVDVAIEFTHPDAVWANLQTLVPTRVPLVVGTTGWAARRAQVSDMVQAYQSALVYGSNFSVGVNVLFALNRHLAELMARFPQYDVALEERHHRHKADAPSGTALTLAEDLMARLPHKDRLAAGSDLSRRPPMPNELSVAAIRAGEIPGTHRVLYVSATDSLEIVHTAHNRDGFAEGAVLAAEWIVGKQGFVDFASLFQG